MSMANVLQQKKQQETTISTISDYMFHKDYEVKDPSGESIGVHILFMYYGELWKSALDRLIHKIDGHLFTITYKGVSYSVYRNIDKTNKETQHYLKLVKQA